MDGDRFSNGVRTGLVAAAIVCCGNALAMDFYDGAHLTIPMVSAGGTIYTNVVTSVAGIVSVEMGTPRGNFDSYNLGTGQLFIPAVSYGGQTYTNVTVTVALANVTHVGGTFGAPSFVLVSNPNDQTIKSYPYGVPAGSANVTATGSVNDANLGNVRPGKTPKLYLDKPNGLLFSAVGLASGGGAVTTYSINLGTGALAPLPGATFTFNTTEGAVDVVNHQIIAVTQGDATIYPYDPASGKVLAAAADIYSDIYPNIITYDPQDSLLFTSDGTHLTAYTFNAQTPQPIVAAQIASTLDSESQAQDLTGFIDQPRRLLFTSDTLSGTSTTKLSAISFTPSSLSVIGNPVAMANSSMCGIDPNVRAIFQSTTGGQPALNVFSYSSAGAINATPLSFNPAWAGSNWGGCSDIDPVNHLVFFQSNQNPGAVSFYSYDASTGVFSIGPTPAGSIAITPGPAQVGVLSTQSLGQN